MGRKKLKRFEEMKILPNVFQPVRDELLGKTLAKSSEWREKLFEKQAPITLELGCGKGEYSLGLARMYKSRNFIGVDIKGSRMWKGAKAAIEEKLNNVAFIRTNIELLERILLPTEVEEIWITFPDPQMKKNKKRLTCARFLNCYQNFLTDNGIVHLKTDSNFMFEYTKAVVEHNHLNIVEISRDIYNEEKLSEELKIKTFYEQQFLDNNMSIKHISFELPHKNIEEPDVEIEPDTYRSFSRKIRM